MKELLYLLIGVIGGVGGGIVFNQPTPGAGWWLIGIALFLLLCMFFYELSKQIWSSKEVWERSSSEDSIPVQGREIDKWRTKGTQKKGDYVRFQIAPPYSRLALKIGHFSIKGKYPFLRVRDFRQNRVIKSIWVMQSPYSSVAFPKKYAITIRHKYGIYDDWNEKEFTITDMQGIKVNFPRPIKINSFIIKIVEAAQYYWGFGRIDIEELRLPFWRHTI